MTCRLKSWTLSLAAVCAALVLAFHFSMTIVYVSPLNMAKLKLLPVVRAYMEPYFAQGWELFAPDPILDSKFLMVSCRLQREGAPEETPLVDVTSRLHHLQHNRITPADRIARAEISAMTLVAPPQDRLTERILEFHSSQDERLRRAAESVKKQKEENREFGFRLLARTASAECDRLYPERKKLAVHLVLVSVSPPKFSERHKSLLEGTKKSLDFGWRPYEHVAPL